jgi:hypothetical protein
MEFTTISDITEVEFKNAIELMVDKNFSYQFLPGEMVQTYQCSPLKISVAQRNGYIKVVTGLENGWPFLGHVIEKKQLTAMAIRYFEGSLVEFRYWKTGALIRMQHALKDTKWVWYGKGELQSWEDENRYRERIIKDRLTARMLESYLNSCGYSEIVT